MVARDEQKQMAGRAAWGDMVDSAVADMVAWDDALGVMTWVTATSRRKEGLTGAGRGKRVTIGRQTRGAQAQAAAGAGAAGAGTGRDGVGRDGVGRKEQADRKGAGANGSRRKHKRQEAGGNWKAGAGRGLDEPEKRPTKLAGPG